MNNRPRPQNSRSDRLCLWILLADYFQAYNWT